MAASVGAMFVVVMPATILRYSARAVGIVPMGIGCLLGSPFGYARSCRAEGYCSESRGESFDNLWVALGRKVDCQGRHTGRCSSRSRLGREVNSAKLRSYEELFSGVRCHVEGCFNGGELQVQPRFQASEPRRSGEGGIKVLR